MVATPFSRAFWACRTSRKRSSINTLRCLLGCTVGDMSMLIGLQLGAPELGPQVTMPLACASGIFTSLLLESTLLHFGKDKLPPATAIKTALNMSFISMLAMEVAENAVEMQMTGGDFSDPVAYLAILPSCAAGFAAAWPYNYYQLRRHGKACH